MRYLFIILALITASPAYAAERTAIFAGGCFWSMEGAFEEVPGVTKVLSGYTGGTVENPSYEQVSAGNTGHVEAVEVFYDPDKISYKQLLDTYWHNVDPFNAEGQFCDRGPEYRSEIFTADPTQVSEALASQQAVETLLGKKTVTKIIPAVTFYPAEEYHQQYKRKNPIRYAQYRLGCGRDRTSEAIWGVAPK